MPNHSTRPQRRRLVLEFSKKVVKREPELPFQLSAVERVGDDLWLAADEGATLERLSPDDERTYSHHASFRLHDYLKLPAGADQEVDLEGIAYQEPYLWLTGSHSLTRKKPKGGKLAADIERLAGMVRATNRFLLARIPLRVDRKSRRSELVSEQTSTAETAVSASRLFGTVRTNLLTDAVEDDAHLGRFLAIPGKENGFDIEGLAALGRSLWLGLRGPVLRGWAVLLEIRPQDLSRDFFTLDPIGPKGALYRKHFLDLGGLGVRDLCRDDDDLLILAGPTLDVSGPLRVLRWRNAAKVKQEQIVEADDLEPVVDLTVPGQRQGVDQAEGICLWPGRRLLVVYDSPGRTRVLAKHRVAADVIAMPR